MNNTDSIIKALSQALNSQLTVTPLADETGVLLDLNGHQVLTLNQTGMAIISYCQTADTNIEQLTASLSEEFDVSPEQARSDIEQYLSNIGETLKL